MGRFSLIKPGIDPEGGELFPPPKRRKWIRVWDEMNWVDSGGTTAANVFLPTVCKHAVSKSRPSSGNITAQHHMTLKSSTQHRHTRLTWLHCFFPPLNPLPPSPSNTGLIFLFSARGVMVVVLLKPAFLTSLKPTSTCLFAVLSLPLFGAALQQSGILSVWFPGLCDSFFWGVCF